MNRDSSSFHKTVVTHHQKAFSFQNSSKPPADENPYQQQQTQESERRTDSLKTFRRRNSSIRDGRSKSYSSLHSNESA